MNKSERDALIQRYTNGHSVVVEALAGITPTEDALEHTKTTTAISTWLRTVLT